MSDTTNLVHAYTRVQTHSNALVELLTQTGFSENSTAEHLRTLSACTATMVGFLEEGNISSAQSYAATTALQINRFAQATEATSWVLESGKHDGPERKFAASRLRLIRTLTSVRNHTDELLRDD